LAARRRAGPSARAGDRRWLPPIRLIREAAAVYAVTSLIGFEALLHDRPVHCFGMPFYAGWGLTHDRLPAPHRRGAARVEDLAHAALVVVPRYAHPDTGAPIEAAQAIAIAAAQRADLLAEPALA
jgi:capsular polysaccharide export protein